MNTRDSSPRYFVWIGGVLPQDDTTREAHPRLDDLEDVAVRRRERLPVDQGRLDVDVARQRPHVVALVVVDGRVVAQPLERRVRVGIDLDVVRVVVDVAVADDRHVSFNPWIIAPSTSRSMPETNDASSDTK